jgi:lipopolysaccharide assembly outer membrane protein LptD (OstA)
MRRLWLIIGVLFAGGALALAQEEQGLKWQFEAPEGGLQYEPDTGLAIATNGIVAKYAGAVLTARRAEVNQNTGEVKAEGNVRLERAGQIWAGDYLEYNFKTGRMRGQTFRTGAPPVFAQGNLLLGDTKSKVYVGAGGYITTDDVKNPGYKVRARRIVVVPGQYVEAWHAVLYLREAPVFYFPYYRHSLKEQRNHISLTPGYRSLFGPFLETSYNWYWNEQLEGTLHVDGRQKRGVGVGPDFAWRLPKYGEGFLKSYYTHDLDPGEDPFTLKAIPENRDRVWFGHQVNVTSNLTAKALIRYQSDAFVTRDFFESEYRKNVQPHSFVEVNQLWSNYSLDLLAQPRVNEFFETVERLPDLKLTGLRQQIGPTPFYYESETSAGYYQRKFAEDTNAPFAAGRADTFQQITLPWTFFNWLNVAPRVGGRYTHYSAAGLSGGTPEEQDRGVFNTGAEASFKASRVWRGAKSEFWQIDGLRHILEPSANYVFVPRPTVPARELPPFDYTVPTTRLLPITFPEFNAIDAIDAQNVVRFGLRNKLQTKRRGGVANVVNWALYTDLRLDPNPTQRTFSDIYSDLDLQPFWWVTVSSETRYDPNDHRLKEANHMLTLAPNATWSWRVGHRYLENLPGFGPETGNNTFFHVFYYRMNENWGARVSHHFEARDGTLEEQQYTLYRDFRSWTGALTLRLRDRREASTDYTVAVTFSLKAYPRYALSEDANQPATMMGY